jgi:hypothetical protein
MIVYRVDPYTEDQRIESRGYPSAIETVVNLEDTIVPVLGWYGDDVSVYSINIAGLRTTEYYQKPYMVGADKFDHRFLNVIRIMEPITPDRITKVGEWEYNPQTKDFDYEEI